MAAYFGGVAVFNRALSPGEMKSLSAIGRLETASADEPQLIRSENLTHK